MLAQDARHFHAFGFVVLRRAFDADALRDELDRALDAGAPAAIATMRARVQYVPMMSSARTPTSLSLLDRFAATAAALLGGEVVPLRAKGMRYVGSTAWHQDSALDTASVGFAAYLEPLTETTGALRVLPGSHRRPFGAAAAAYFAELGAAMSIDSMPAFAIATEPGDVIVFDEHLFHASSGGTHRRQWRVDYFLAPRSPAEAAGVREYLANVFPPDWDGGYDVDLFPSYGCDWLQSGRTAVDQLRALGVYELAQVQESFMRRRRNSRE
jgi:hypothetical protein